MPEPAIPEPVTPDQVMAASFTVGGGVAVIASPLFAVFDAVNRDLAARLWSTAAAGGGIDDLLEQLSSMGLKSLGSFAVGQVEGDTVRVVVRGTGHAVVQTGSMMQVVAPRGVRTWVEEIVGHAGAFELSVDDSGGAGKSSLGALSFRVERGLVPAESVRWTPESHPRVADADVQAAVDLRTSHPLSVRDDLPPPAPPAPVQQRLVEDDDGRTRVSVDELRPNWLTDDNNAPTPGELSGNSVPGADSTPDAGEYDEIYGRTVSRSVQAAAVRSLDESLADGGDHGVGGQGAGAAGPQPASAPGAVSAPSVEAGSASVISAVPGGAGQRGAVARSEVGDHDGRTMTPAQLAALRAGGRGADPAPTAPSSPMGGPAVPALMCPAGHANPPQLSFCTRCGGRLDGSPVTVARPPMGVLRFSNGMSVVLDRPALIGRNPKLEGVAAGEMPSVVKLDAGQGLSRTHAAVRIEGWTVLLDDLNSANGTVVRLPGREPRRLHPGEPVLLEPGSEIDFGGEVSCRLDME